MFKCKECGQEFDDHDEAFDHVKEGHTAEVDECLMEWINEAQQLAYENLIKEPEEY